MKVTNQNLLKILSVLLIFTMLVANTVSMLVSGVADGDDGSSVVYEPVDDIGNTVFSVFNNDGYNITDREGYGVVKPTLVKEGVDNSYAIKLGATTGYKENLIRWQYNDTDRMRFELGVAYTVEFKMKKVSGRLDNVYAGIFYNYPLTYTYTDSYTDADLNSDGWTTVKISSYATNQNLSPTDSGYYTNGRHMFINFVASEGLVVLVDDIRIYATNDTAKTELFKGSYLIKNNAPYAGGTDYPGTFDKIIEQGGYNDYIYEPASSIGNIETYVTSNSGYNITGNASVVKPAIVNEGVDGSYAVKFGANTGFKGARLRWQYTDATRTQFKAGKPYTFEFKVKKVSGTLGNLYAGIFLNWKSPGSEHSWSYSDSFTDSQISATEWTTVKIEGYAFNQNLNPTDPNYYTEGRFFYINFTSADNNGCVLLFDEIRIYASDDTEKTDMFLGANLLNYTGGIEHAGDFDKKLYPNRVDTGDSGSYDAADDIGYYLGDAETAPGNDLTVLDENGTKLSGDDLKSAAPVIVDGGTKKSNALSLNSGKAVSQYLIRFRLKDSYIAENINIGDDYIVELNALRSKGKITNLKAGFYNGDSDTIENTAGFGGAYLDENAGEDKWTNLKFTNKAEADSKYIYISFTLPEGGELMIDDIVLYAAGDSSKTNLFTDKSIQTDSKGTAYTGGAIYPGTFDKRVNYYIEKAEENIDPDKVFVSDGPYYETHWSIPLYPELSASGDGFNDSYALQVGNAETLTNEVHFMAGKLQTLKGGGDYTVSFKIRVKEGSLKSLSAGILENTVSNPVPADSVFGYIPVVQAGGEIIDDQWHQVTFSTVMGECTNNWKRIYISYEANAGGAVLLIDDIMVFETTDINKTPIDFLKGVQGEATFDIEAVKGKPVNETQTTEKLVPAKFYDWSLQYDANGKLIESVWNTNKEAFPSIYQYSDVETRYALRPRASELGEGVNGTYALVLGDENIPTKANYSTAFSYIETSTIYPNTEYTFSVKIKREGTVDRLRIGFDEHLNRTTRYYSLNLEDFLMSDEYLEYTWKYTTSDVPDVTWNALVISYESSTGAKIYIDDLDFWRSDTNPNANVTLFGNGDFEYVDKGLDPVPTVLSKDMPEGESARLTSVYSNRALGNTTNTARVMSSSNVHAGAEGTAVLALGFEDTPSEISYASFLYATQPGKTYKISFWVKVIGDVDYATVGMADSFWLSHFYKPGYSFNQYEHNKWTKVEFTWTDPGTRFNTVSYRRFFVRFKGAAGTGMLIDDVRVVYEPLGADAPNIFDDGTFSKLDKSYSNIEWDTNYIYKKEEK